MLYCRVDGTEMGDLLEELAVSAEAYLEDSGCVYTAANAPYYELAIKSMTLHYLDKPGEPIPGGIQSIINKLKFTPSASAGE